MKQESTAPKSDSAPAGVSKPAVPLHEAHAPVQDLREWRLIRERNRLQFWRAALVGLLAGGLAVGFQVALAYSESRRAALLGFLHERLPWVGWLVLPLITAGLGAGAAWVTQRFAPEAAGSGIPHIKGVLMHARVLQWLRLLPVKFFGGVVAIGAGFSLGREGPTVQLGAVAGRVIGGILGVPRQARLPLIACGAGAGLAAAFNAPLAGFIFVIEELQRELSPLTYGMALIAAVVANIVTCTIFGQQTAFHVYGYPTPPLTALPLFVVVGVVTGVLGVAFSKGLIFAQQQCAQRLKLPGWQRAALIGLAIGVVGWWLPEALGTGHRVAESVLLGKYASFQMLDFLAILFVGKFVLTLVSYMAGVPGGIFAPMLVLGSVLGLMVGLISSYWFPAAVGTPAAFAVAGMAGFFSAVVRAPLTGIVLVLEMTGNYEQLLPLLVSCMLAYVIAEHMNSKPVYDALLGVDLHQKARQPVHREPMLVEIVVERDSPMDGCQVCDLGLPEGCLLVTITRHGGDIIPHGDTVTRAGDHVTVVVAGDVAVTRGRLNALSRVY